MDKIYIVTAKTEYSGQRVLIRGFHTEPEAEDLRSMIELAEPRLKLSIEVLPVAPKRLATMTYTPKTVISGVPTFPERSDFLNAGEEE